MEGIKKIRKLYTKELYSLDFTKDILYHLYTFLESERVDKLELFSQYDKATILCAIEHLNQLREENERYKEINDGLLKVQIDLRQKESENKQWFKAASENVNDMDKLIKQLQDDVEFYKSRDKVNKKITQELVELNDNRVVEILTKTRILGE